jgi:hypothetical protein
MPRRRSAIALCLVLLACARSSADLGDILGPRTLAAVRAAGKLTRNTADSHDLRYLPTVPGREAIRDSIDEARPTVVVELLALARRTGRRLEGAADRLAIANVLRSVSRLEGLQYYSASHGRMRLLYKTSYRIVSPENRHRLEDPLVTAPPAHEEVWVYQEDTTFGGNVYAVSYDIAERSVRMKVVNQTTMRYFVLPMVQPGGMVLSFLIVPDGEDLVFYAVAAARVNGPWARAGAIQESFTNRVDAMYRWFGDLLAAP